MTRLPRAGLVLAVLPALAMIAPPASAAPSTVQVEAESVRSSTPAVVVADASASGRRARVLAGGTTLTVRLSAPASGSRLVVRLRTSGAAAAPVLTVDGRRVGAVAAPGRTWGDHTVGAGLIAGAHTVTIANPSRTPLLVDRVSAVPARPRAVTTAPLDDAYEARIVQLANAARAAAGLAPLRVSACADGYAEQGSASMARTSAFQHRPALGTILTACRASAVGENIATGQVTADQMMSMWMRSPGHRANLLSRRFTHIGVGAVTTADGRTYGTQNFLRLGSPPQRGKYASSQALLNVPCGSSSRSSAAKSSDRA